MFITDNVYIQKYVGEFILHGADLVLESFSFLCFKFEILSKSKTLMEKYGTHSAH
jgi:hypothetical protein